MRILRQAIVLIHGIGEQRPMDTLRSFVEGVLPGEPYFSKPDSRSFELRRLTIRTGGRAQTDFFEYYWADKVEGTTLRHLLQWFRTLLLRCWRNVPGNLRPLWLTSWMLVGTLLAMILLLTLAPERLGLPGRLATVILSFVFGLPQLWLLYYLGDAARYLSPTPENIKVRREIKESGVKLLRALHESRKYDRIIMVGHSLGSVIGYDILTHYWAECHDVFDKPRREKQLALVAYEQLICRSTAATQLPAAEYRAAQRCLWEELQSHGFRWRISDFVTLGAPLAHAPLLLARDSGDLNRRKRDRELPQTPPVIQGNRISYVPNRPLKTSTGQLVSLRVPDHGAVFCCTRWTNLYFPAALGLFGDIVGGPVAPWFGPGVRDEPVSTPAWGGLLRFTIGSHTHYWRSKRGQGQREQQARPEAVAELRAALDLSFSPSG